MTNILSARIILVENKLCKVCNAKYVLNKKNAKKVAGTWLLSITFLIPEQNYT